MTDRDGRMAAVRSEMDALLGRSALCRAPLPETDMAAPLPTAPPAAAAGRRRGIGLAVLLSVGVVSGIAIGGWPARPVVADGVRQSVGGKAATATPAPSVASVPVDVPTLDLAAIDAARPNDVGREPAEPADVYAAADIPAAAPPAPRPAADRRPAERGDDCARYDGEDALACRYDRLLDADGRLAAAYDRAVDAGVPVDDLRMLRREWARARRYAEDDPDGVTQAFDAIAADLRAASRAYGSRASL